jgi:hypothetical protein
MRGAIYQYMKEKGLPSRTTEAVEAAKARHAEACECRLARIQNGKEPSHKNGTPYPVKPAIVVP